MKYIFIILFIIINLLAIRQNFAWSSYLDLKNYSQPLEFNNKKVVLIKKGDNSAYKKNNYDDKEWKLISLPSSWQNIYPGWKGICWYRIHIKFPESLPDKSLGISLGVISDTDQVFFNGQLIGKTGVFPPQRESAYDRIRLYELPTKYILTGKDNVIAIRVSALFDFINGPHQGKFSITSYSKLQSNLYVKEFFNLLFVVIYFLVSIYFLFLFLVKTNDREYLFFSLFSFSVAAYFFLWTQIKYLVSNDFLLMKRLEYLLLIIILPLMFAYITLFFKRKIRLIHYMYYTLSLTSLLLVLISNNIYVWNRIIAHVIQPAWLLPAGYCLFISAKELKQDINAKYILGSFLVIFLILINDVLIFRNIYKFIRLSNYGFLVIIIGTAIIMRNRLAYLFQEIDKLKSKHSGKIAVTENAKLKLNEVLLYLNKNYIYDISREGLAEEVSISPDYLGKLFKHYMGKRINDYINELRINKAIRLLKMHEKSVIDIAFAVGFESLSTFYRVFQKVTGVSPTSYQKKE